MSKNFNSILWLLTEKVGGTFISLISFVIFAVKLSPNEIGIATIALSISLGFGQVLSSFYQDPIVCKKKLKRKDIYAILNGSVIASSLLIICIIFFSYLILGFSDLSYLICISSLVIPLLSLNSIFMGVYRRNGQFKSMSRSLLMAKFSSSIIAVTLVFYGVGNYSLILQILLLEFFTLIFFLNVTKHRVKKIIDINIYYKIIKLGIYIAIRKLSWEGYIKLIPIVIGYYLGAATVGAFAFAWRVIDMPRTAFSSGAISFVLPFLSKGTNRKATKGLFFEANKTTMIFLCPFFIGLAFITEPLITFFFGDKWLESIPIIQGLCLFCILSFSRMYIPALFMTINMPQNTLKTDVFSSVIAIVFCILFIDFIGVYAVVASFYLKVFINYPITFVEVKKNFDIGFFEYFTPFISPVISTIFMSLVLSLISNFLYQNELIKMVLLILGGACSYIVAFYIHDKKTVSNFINLVRS